MKIYKYPISHRADNEYLNAEFKIKMPADAQILHVGVQNGIIILWALVDPELGLNETKTIRIFATGFSQIPDFKKYLGTVMLGGGTFVWHLFEV